MCIHMLCAHFDVHSDTYVSSDVFHDVCTDVYTSATQLAAITAQLLVDVKNIPPTAPDPYSFGR